MNFYKKLGEIRPNQLITTYGPGSIMDAVNDSLTVLDIEYTDLLLLQIGFLRLQILTVDHIIEHKAGLFIIQMSVRKHSGF